MVSLTPMFSVLPRVGLVHSSTILRLKRHSISSMPVRIPFQFRYQRSVALMVELNLINPEHKHRSHLCHNTSKKFDNAHSVPLISMNDSDSGSLSRGCS